MSFKDPGDVLIAASIINYYRKNVDDMEKTVDIVMRKSDVSISLVEWFVVNYSKDEGVSIFVDKKTGSLIDAEQVPKIKRNNVREIMVNVNYDSQLKSFKKKRFDPFCRGEKINFEYKKGKRIITSIAQLNFFKWLCETKILDYIETNLDELKMIRRENNN